MTTTFLITCVGTFLVTGCLCLLVLKRFFKDQKKQQAHDNKKSAVVSYEMVNTEKTTEAEYEVIDHHKKGVTLEENPAYSVHA